MPARLAAGLSLCLLCFGGCGASTHPTGPDVSEPYIGGAQARTLVAEGAILLDVTPESRASRSLIEGRTHIPLADLEARLGELPLGTPIVVYCLGGRGSPQAAALLRERGYDVYLLGARARWDGP